VARQPYVAPPLAPAPKPVPQASSAFFNLIEFHSYYLVKIIAAQPNVKGRQCDKNITPLTYSFFT